MNQILSVENVSKPKRKTTKRKKEKAKNTREVYQKLLK